MKEQMFKVGDRVLATDNLHMHNTPAPGKIVRLYRSEPLEGKYDYLVRFDDGEELWSNVTSPLCKKQPVIVITSDGKTTTAIKRLGKKVINTATAVCSDGDTFDFNTGAKLAMERLMETEKPWPKKLVCVESQVESLTVGRIYPVLHGSGNYGEIKANFGSWGIRKYSDSDFRINNFPYDGRFIPLVED